MNEKILEHIEEYKKSGNNTFSDSEYISGFDEFDLWMGVRAFDYELEISERTYKSGFLFWKKKETEYVINVTVTDTYDFNSKTDSGDGIGSILNNLAYSLHEKGIGNDYEWTLNYQTTIR